MVPTTLPTVLPRALFATLAALAIASCSNISDEDQVLAVINAGELAFEARNTADVLELVATDYKDALGFDKTQLESYLRIYFLSHPKVELLVHSSAVEFETETRARVRIEVVMVGTHRTSTESTLSSGALTGESESFQVELRRRDSKWQVLRVDGLRHPT